MIPFREMYDNEEQRTTIEKSASSRIRCDFIAKYWPEVKAWSKAESKNTISDQFDVYVFQKAYSRDIIDIASKLKSLKKKIIFDLCDAEWVYPPRTETLSQMLRLADHVTTSSYYLFEYVSKNYGRPCTMILDRYDLSLYPKSAVKVHTESEFPTIVWFGNRNTIQYLNLIEPAILRIRPPFNLLLISDRFEGWHPAPQHQYRLQTLPWSLEHEIENITKGDVVINPHSDDEIGRAKSDNKTSLSWALGMPVVSHGNEHRIASVLANYLRHPEIRNEVGSIGRSMVEKFYDCRLSVIEWQRVVQLLYK